MLKISINSSDSVSTGVNKALRLVKTWNPLLVSVGTALLLEDPVTCSGVFRAADRGDRQKTRGTVLATGSSSHCQEDKKCKPKSPALRPHTGTLESDQLGLEEGILRHVWLPRECHGPNLTEGERRK